jgi:hypothetical protein
MRFGPTDIFGFRCILDVSAELGDENLHVVGHNAQTVETDIQTLLVLEINDERRSLIEEIRRQQQNVVAALYGIYGSAVCPNGEGCEHDHGRSLEGQVGENQRIAEENLKALIVKHNHS